MKNIYKIMFLLAFLQGVIIMVNSLGVFPNTFYMDNEIQNINDPDSLPTAEEWFIQMFRPNIPIFGNSVLGVTAIVGVFLGAGVISGIALRGSFIPVVISFQGYMIFTMLTNSKSFFDKLLTGWGTSSLMYLSLLFGLGIIMLLLITILETASNTGDA